LLFVRNFADQEQIIQTADIRHFRAFRLRQTLQQVGDGVTPQTDAFIRIHVRDIRHQSTHTAHTAVNLRNRYLADLFVAVFMNQAADPVPPLGQLFFDLFLE
jgi:hypothetical protein